MASASAGGGNPTQALAAAMSRRMGAAAGDKSSAFSMTCSRLSQYLKEKGNLGGLGLAFDAAAAAKGTKQEPPRTMNLLPGIESSKPEPTPEPAAATNPKLVVPREQQLLPAAAVPLPQAPPGAQMTIFYGGKVIVFDNYPADKAKDLLALAGRGIASTPPKAQGSSVMAAAAAAPLSVPAKAAPAPVADILPAAAAAPVAPASPAVVAPVAAAAAAVSQDRTPKPPQVPIASDLPIARRVSLNRFLEKRKDRISSKAPYPMNAAAAASSDGKPLFDKEKQPQQAAMPPLEKERLPQHQPPMMPLSLKEKEKQQSWLGLAPSESL